MSTRVFPMSGHRFSQLAGTVAPADEVTAAITPEEKFRLPDDVTSILVELRGRTPAEEQELQTLIAERFDLNNRTVVYIARQLAAKHRDLEQKREQARCAVREQQQVLRDLLTQLQQDNQYFVRLDNERRMLSNAAQVAAQERQGLSYFASQREKDVAQKRVIEAEEKMHTAEAKAAEAGQLLNNLKMVTIPQENKKLVELVEVEVELAAQLEGRDPVLAKFGFMQR